MTGGSNNNPTPALTPHASAQSNPRNQITHQVERGLLLDVVVRERAPVLQLLPREDEALLVGRDALLFAFGWRGGGLFVMVSTGVSRLS